MYKYLFHDPAFSSLGQAPRSGIAGNSMFKFLRDLYIVAHHVNLSIKGAALAAIFRDRLQADPNEGREVTEDAVLHRFPCQNQHGNLQAGSSLGITVQGRK